jgi:hypothetical protein
MLISLFILQLIKDILLFCFDRLTLTVFNCEKNVHECDAFKINKKKLKLCI